MERWMDWFHLAIWRVQTDKQVFAFCLRTNMQVVNNSRSHFFAERKCVRLARLALHKGDWTKLPVNIGQLQIADIFASHTKFSGNSNESIVSFSFWAGSVHGFQYCIDFLWLPDFNYALCLSQTIFRYMRCKIFGCISKQIQIRQELPQSAEFTTHCTFCMASQSQQICRHMWAVKLFQLCYTSILKVPHNYGDIISHRFSGAFWITGFDEIFFLRIKKGVEFRQQLLQRIEHPLSPCTFGGKQIKHFHASGFAVNCGLP